MMAFKKSGPKEGAVRRDEEAEYVTSVAAAERRGKISIQVGEIMIKGELSEGAVRRILNSNIRSIEACLKDARGTHHPMAKKLVVRILINLQGKVTEVKLDKGIKIDGAVAKCMTDKLREVRFPKLKSGGKAIVKVTFTLT